jgi:hypothetical protein
VSYFDYDALVEESFRGVVKKILEEVSQKGLRGDHHFYITYKTNFPGVILPSYLLQKYPDEITLLLQYEFWNLQVNYDSFTVTLNFNEELETLTVPFTALINFFDPSTRFGLQFTPVPPPKSKKNKKTGLEVSSSEEEKKESKSKGPSKKITKAENEEEDDGKNNVITLDFSKKK